MFFFRAEKICYEVEKFYTCNKYVQKQARAELGQAQEHSLELISFNELSTGLGHSNVNILIFIFLETPKNLFSVEL